MRSEDVDAKIALISNHESRAIARVLCDSLIARGSQPIARASGTGGRIDFGPIPLSIWVNRGGTIWLHNVIRGRRQGYPEVGLNEIPGYEEPSVRRSVFEQVRGINAALQNEINFSSSDSAEWSPQPSLVSFREVVDLDRFLTIYDPIIDMVFAKG